MEKSKIYIPVCYLLLYTIWSTTYISIKTGVSTIPTLLFVGLRWLFSGLFLAVIAYFLYREDAFKGITKEQAINSAITGIFIIILNNLFFSESLRGLDSYFAAIITATAPLVMVIFDYSLNGIKFSRVTFLAILLGIFGIAVLLYEGSFKAAFNTHVLLLLASVTFFSFGSALSRRLEQPQNTIANSAIQMLFAGFTITGLFFYGNETLEISRIALGSVIALIYIILLGSIGMLSFIYLIKHEPLSRVSTYAFVTPIGATVLAVFFGESLKQNFFIAAPMILIALLLMLSSRKELSHPESEGER